MKHAFSEGRCEEFRWKNPPWPFQEQQGSAMAIALKSLNRSARGKNNPNPFFPLSFHVLFQPLLQACHPECSNQCLFFQCREALLLRAGTFPCPQCRQAESVCLNLQAFSLAQKNLP